MDPFLLEYEKSIRSIDEVLINQKRLMSLAPSKADEYLSDVLKQVQAILAKKFEELENDDRSKKSIKFLF